MATPEIRMVIYSSLIIALLCGISGLTADDATRQRFVSEYPNAAKYLSDRFDRCKGRYRYEWDENGRRSSADVEFFRSHGFDKYEIRSSQAVGSKTISGLTVYCIDNLTGFLVSRVDGESKWTLYKTRMSEFEREILDIDYSRIPRAPLGGYQKSLIKMLNDGSVELMDAQVSADDPAIVEATFRVDDKTPLKQIKASFDTKNHWAITHETIYVGSPLRASTDYQVEYGSNFVDGIRLPVRLNVEKQKLPYQFGEWKFEEIPRDSFLLTHYGLPDVITPSKRSRFGWFEWLLLAAVAVSIALGIVLYRLSLRRPDLSQARQS